MKRTLFLFLCLPWLIIANAQPITKKVLFLGNSYTYANNLPVLVAALANASGDSLLFDAYTPGGYTLGWQPTAHSVDPLSLSMIRQSDWDYVVLQEQSQTPAIPALRDSCMFPGAMILHDSVKSNNFCSRVLFYLTWGRRFGGIQCFTPNYCSTNFSDFDQMQDSLTVAYKEIADSLDAPVAPVGEAWRLILHTTNMILHDGDQSHPNLKGSYLAACVFYSSVFQKRSTGNSFTAGLLADTALVLQRAADSVVFGYSAYWNLWQNEPEAAFTLEVSGDSVITHNESAHANYWNWTFGDGSTSLEFEPVHVYPATGTYVVTLEACDTCRCDTTSRDVSIIVSGTRSSETTTGYSLTWAPDGSLHCLNCPQSASIVLYDLTGRLVFKQTIIDGRGIIPELEPGIYFWIIKSNSILSKGKIILIR
jgi:PKD repeat protein